MVAVKKITEKNTFTYTDYAQWETDDRYELIDGVPYAMGSPTTRHQRIIGELFVRLHDFLKGKSCEVFISPLDVRLNYDTKDDTVVQPDIMVICDKNKIDDKSIKGAPDLVVEILSPSNKRFDFLVKHDKYFEAGIPEYWIVDPIENIVHVFILKDGNYIAKVYGDTDTLPSHILDGCNINLKEIFG